MPEQPPLVRQWLLLGMLCSRRGGLSVREMAEEMSTSQKTIRRDLEVFQQAGFPLEETVGERGRKTWRIEPAKGTPALSFCFDEAMALYLGRRFLEPLAGTVFWEAAQRAFKKIRASLGTAALRYVDRFGSVFHHTVVGASDYSCKGELIDQLMVGIEDHRAVFITYQSLQATEPVTYDVYPYGLTYHRGSLYLIGWSPDHEAVRHWKVDRIEQAEPTEVRFTPPEDFDMKRHLAKSFGIFQGAGDVHVKVRFSANVARYVEEGQWHTSQQLTRQSDHSLLAEFRLSSTEEIKRWVLGFGKAAEVVGPEGLRREMAEELRALLGQYRAGKTRRARRTRARN